MLTVKAMRLLQRADVVISDQLIAKPILSLISTSKLILVERKVAGRSDAAQMVCIIIIIMYIIILKNVYGTGCQSADAERIE